MTLHISKHPLVGMILRQINRPWDRFKVVSVKSGEHESITWFSVGEIMPENPTTMTKEFFHLLEIDPNQTDGPIDKNENGIR